MIRSAGLFLLWTSLWCWQVRLSQCYTYELRAHVTLRDEDYEKERLLVGDFTEYGKKSTEKTKGRLVSVDATYGCQGSNSTLEGASSAFIAILPLSDCNDYLQAKKAEQERAIGVVFYYTSDKDKEWSSGEEDLSIPVAVIKVDVDAVGRITGRDAPAYYSVEVEGQLYPVVPQQRTFYFIVTAICILILLSCLWFFTSYFRRCRYSFRNQRRQARAENTARKAISKLKVRSYKTSKDSQETENCAVCLELYSNNDAIRVLPCRHEFHKNCVDPWLKLKHTCPLCKSNITTKSSPSSPSSTEDPQRHETTPTLTTPPPLSPSMDTLASSSSNSSSSNDSSPSATSSTVLLATSTQLAITLDEEVELPTTAEQAV